MSIRIEPIQAENTWPLRHEVMWPDRSIDYVKLEKDAQGIHLGLFKNDELIAVISAFIEGTEAQFRKFATKAQEQGKGYGSQLLTYLIKQLLAKNVTRIWCNARVDKSFFYKRFGLTETHHKFAKGGIDYVIMEKVISED